MNTLTGWKSKIHRKLLGTLIPDSVAFEGLTLPAPSLRLCGAAFRDNTAYVASAKREARRLQDEFQLTPKSEILDIGSGYGRLATGILSVLGNVQRYEGIDVQLPSILWCQKNFTAYHPSFRFTHLDLQNALYNPGGRAAVPTAQLPFQDQSFDLIYLYSVFSHLLEPDVRHYLSEFNRLLRPSGAVFVTAFAKPGVANVMENPNDGGQQWHKPLHCVRYEKNYFENMVRENGLAVEKCSYETETDCQSAYRLRKS